MPAVWEHRGCGFVAGGPGAMQAHQEQCGQRWAGWDQKNQAPSKKMPAGTRVSWEHSDGTTRSGTVWSEAPTVKGSHSGAGPTRHVIPDYERSTVQLPLKGLTQIADHMSAASQGLFRDRRPIEQKGA